MWSRVCVALAVLLACSHAAEDAQLQALLQVNPMRTCPQTAQEIENLREERIDLLDNGYYRVTTWQGNISDAAQAADFFEVFSTEDVILTILLTGVFPGREQTVEYILLTNPKYNGGIVKFSVRRRLNGAERWDGDQVTINVFESAENADGESASGTIDETFGFEPCSLRIKTINSQLSAPLQDVIITEPMTATELCTQALFLCPANFYPYDSFLHCIAELDPKPARCLDPNLRLAGDTLACRSIHLLSALIDPVIHCAHLAEASTPCFRDACPEYSEPGTPSSFLSPRTPGFKDDNAEQTTALVAMAWILTPLILAAFVVGCTCKAVKRLQAASIATRTVDRNKTMRIHRTQPVSNAGIIFSDLSVTVGAEDKKKKLVNNVFGTVRGGTMVALMGESGAGKTTLLTTLASQNKWGQVTGKLAYTHGDNTFISDDFARNYVSLVPQFEDFPALLTIKEIFVHRAMLLVSTDPDAKGKLEARATDSAMEVIRALALTGQANTAYHKLSGGQQRRVSVGVHMLNFPAILLMDEPTSGLDSHSTLDFIQVIKRLCQKGMTSIMTIHQPRDSVFRKFDQVFMLQPGGRILLSGSLSQIRRVLQAHHQQFERDQEDIKLYMADVVSDVLSDKASMDWITVALSKDTIVAINSTKQSLKQISFTSPFDVTGTKRTVNNFATQVQILTYEFYKTQKAVDLYLPFILSLVIYGVTASVFYDAPPVSFFILVQRYLGILIIAVGLFNIQAFQLCGVRGLSDRSKLVSAAKQSYDHVLATWFHIFVRDSVWVVIATMLAVAPYYYTVGLNAKAESFGHVALAMLLYLHGSQALLHAAFVYTDFAVAASITGTMTAWNSVFSGFLVAVPNLPGFWRHWASYITPLYHVFNIVLHYDLHGLVMDCESDAVPQVCSTGDYGLDVFLYNEIAPFKSMIVLLAYDVAGWFLLGLLLHFIRQKHVIHTSTDIDSNEDTTSMTMKYMKDIPTLTLYGQDSRVSMREAFQMSMSQEEAPDMEASQRASWI
eukprot:m.219161 g.219161  ORF g.219161 m.219161 type:complete len:1012 (+) comp17227_c0_seq1:2419-5454(+)